MKSPAAVDLHLTLFFTHSVSLRKWDEAGILPREAALYQRLQEHGVQVSFVTYGDASELQYEERLPGIAILCNRWGLRSGVYDRLLPFLYAQRFRRSTVIKTNQTDGADIALRVARLWRKPLVARCGYMWSKNTARRYGDDSPQARRACQIEAHVFAAAQRIVVTTAEMAADVAQRVPAAAARTQVIPNHVDVELFRPSNGAARDFDIVFVGRLAPPKNVAALLQAVRALPVSVLLIGDGKLRESLQRAAAAMGSRIHWQPRVSNDELPGYLNRAELFVLPSHYEGHPKAMIEAMACGMAVIGADSPGIRGLIRHGETGWMCGTDSASIGAAIQQLLARPSLRAELGRNARQYVLEHFALDRVVEMELALLRGLLL